MSPPCWSRLHFLAIKGEGRPPCHHITTVIVGCHSSVMACRSVVLCSGAISSGYVTTIGAVHGFGGTMSVGLVPSHARPLRHDPSWPWATWGVPFPHSSTLSLSTYSPHGGEPSESPTGPDALCPSLYFAQDIGQVVVSSLLMPSTPEGSSESKPVALPRVGYVGCWAV